MTFSAKFGIFISLSLYLFTVTAGQGAPASSKPLSFMEGTWKGDERTIVIDTERMLANTDPKRPFQHDYLIIRNITGVMVHFSTGSLSFMGHFQGEELALTGDGIKGTIHLKRTLGRR